MKSECLRIWWFHGKVGRLSWMGKELERGREGWRLQW